ncbi:MAG: nucleotidyltransferase [Clostridia bacterium]|nr:nucleotidyltransferase [Clostridia bacterium]
MKILGIIAEYNPFHNGHIYHIQKAKKETGCDFAIAIMSGSFTQQGNIALYDKFKRAKIATNHGIDLVIELPTIYANSSSEYFSKGAIEILNSLNIVDNICFGSESGNLTTLLKISNTIRNNEIEIWQDIQKNLKKGISFAKAREQSITRYLNSDEVNEISKPNNILGIEYLLRLSRLSSNIKPYTIARISNDFNSIHLNPNQKYTSATSIRNSIYHKKSIDQLNTFIPEDMMHIINTISPTFNDQLLNILKYKIVTSKKEEIASINEVTEGLENRIIDSVSHSSDYNELVNHIKSKRYQMSKIKRMLNNILLGITKEDMQNIANSKQLYAHVLSTSHNGKILLSRISKKSDILLLTSINEKILSNLTIEQKRMLELDILSSNIHSIINHEKINKDYTNRL